MEETKAKDPMGWESLSNYPEISRDVRQDCIIEEKTKENLVHFPLRPYFPEDELRTLDIADVYNTTSHLGNLSIVAHAINERFHEAVRSIYGIDGTTNISKDGKIVYRSGPIKDMVRCKAKTEDDYSGEPFPSSTKVVDFVRGSMVFSNCKDCVEALEKLKVAAESKKTCIKQVGRIKNMCVFSFFLFSRPFLSRDAPIGLSKTNERGSPRLHMPI